MNTKPTAIRSVDPRRRWGSVLATALLASTFLVSGPLEHAAAETGAMIFPTSGSVPDGGMPGDSRDGGSRTHKGLDISAPTGTPVVAAAAGTVASIRCETDRGWTIRVSHSGGYQTIYQHLKANSWSVSAGQSVAQGAALAQVGTTGTSNGTCVAGAYGAHLHFEVLVNNTPNLAWATAAGLTHHSSVTSGTRINWTFPGLGSGGPAVPEAVARAYVTKLYFDLLGRAPDTQGLADWSRLLVNGTPYVDVANGITASDEYHGLLIAASYRQYLGREVDPAGAQGWLQTMRAGSQIEDVQANLVASPEFYANAGGTDTAWVARVYAVVLGRTAGASEINAWVAQLNGGASRVAVARGFLFSTEHLNSVVDGYYLALLDRHVDPTGQTTWVQHLQSGWRDEQVIAGLVSSPEYLNAA